MLESATLLTLVHFIETIYNAPRCWLHFCWFFGSWLAGRPYLLAVLFRALPPPEPYDSKVHLGTSSSEPNIRGFSWSHKERPEPVRSLKHSILFSWRYHSLTVRG